MTKDEIRKWAQEELLPLHSSRRGKPLKDKINELIKAAMMDGKVPGWVVSNMLTDLAQKHGYR
jgi:hypothetical protein